VYRVRWRRLGVLLALLAAVVVLASVLNIYVFPVLVFVGAVTAIGIVSGHFNVWGGGTLHGFRNRPPTDPYDDDEEFKRPRDEGGSL
jgi:hypothetical protein